MNAKLTSDMLRANDQNQWNVHTGIREDGSYIGSIERTGWGATTFIETGTDMSTLLLKMGQELKRRGF